MRSGAIRARPQSRRDTYLTVNGNDRACLPTAEAGVGFCSLEVTPHETSRVRTAALPRARDILPAAQTSPRLAGKLERSPSSHLSAVDRAERHIAAYWQAHSQCARRSDRDATIAKKDWHHRREQSRLASVAGASA
jgi:hypothetical protein